ncbi:GntR family transcriptional regulator [Alkalihalobacillus alcalophilus ATCC 27647 = CGMCC 1.3604]|uniref:GntR family transcriptional regulator n=1 Tax=Alkalihalobacillus alcalophilus ATCC 27647 = CGMCC 1.3604 TaxID=1218173 RepID=A0A094WFW8_ALKAL|nr:GntR family transcriptional regulator [Alkalihalobacillus alcalophilus]KGA96669.1 GntR family transcriptional regulator [Alkalihalobacillus alcalophilus ATCC 27647 = CGMCC 1.3604]MED1561819.1 GntR family transcriptional regulator [Alkalihalobacillus alcalophilus]THG90986.1 GntR family transcriptional regulator [Alkalihalobacillus alcalophilus ATCC 27647 = CGMCC 1.3604]
MQILISNQSKEPIYEQISNQIKNLILTGALSEGEPLPSMRQLAKNLQISVITTKRAYEELEKTGLIYSIVGKGSFVSEQNSEILKEKKLKVVEEKLIEAIKNAKDLNIPLTELKEMLTILYEEEK